MSKAESACLSTHVLAENNTLPATGAKFTVIPPHPFGWTTSFGLIFLVISGTKGVAFTDCIFLRIFHESASPPTPTPITAVS